ncbi:hypothetical protein FHT77_002696 [Rhizobium sp. BK181]|nr:hypothetical protein [Rhizobium sp. BK181]
MKNAGIIGMSEDNPAAPCLYVLNDAVVASPFSGSAHTLRHCTLGF